MHPAEQPVLRDPPERPLRRGCPDRGVEPKPHRGSAAGQVGSRRGDRPPLVLDRVEAQQRSAPRARDRAVGSPAEARNGGLRRVRPRFGIQVPGAGRRLEAAHATVGPRPDAPVRHRDVEDLVAREPAVELRETIEAARGETDQADTQRAQPDVAGAGIRVDGTDRHARQSVGRRPAPPPVVAVQSQSGVRSHPDIVPGDVDRPYARVGEPVLDAEVLPSCLDRR
jgi:hypothetical protein